MNPSLKRKIVSLLLVLLAAAYAAGAAYAQGGGPTYPTDDDVNRVAKQLYCPVCPNTPLDVCETQACQDWRAQIRDQLAQGWSDQQVIDYFVAQYGERVLAEPQRRGFASLLWFLPVVSALLGLWIVYEILKGWRKQNQKPPPMAVQNGKIPQDVLDRIERELREIE